VSEVQGADLFLSLAEIAGVFVGFGALIAVRGGGGMQTREVNDIRWVVTTAIWVVIAALAPIVVSSYGPTGHELWLGCSLLALAFLAVMTTVFSLTPENRAELADNLANTCDGRQPAENCPNAMGSDGLFPTHARIATRRLR
jgi:hypothetical protein